LNVDVPAHLAALAKELGFTFVLISTGILYISCFSLVLRSLSHGLSIDYVFDGTSPPYVPSAQPNPLNLYGITKRDAELAVLRVGVEGAHAIVLRVPVLYVLSPLPSIALV
jgi:S-adenosylmethionine synthetase